ETRGIREPSEAIRLEQRPMPWKMIPTPPAVLEKPRIPGIDVGRLNHQAAIRREPAGDLLHDPSRIRDVLDHVEHGREVNTAVWDFRATLDTPLEGLVATFPQRSDRLVAQLQAIYSALRNAALRKEIEIAAVAAADIEK